jgi:hypothetical protein
MKERLIAACALAAISLLAPNAGHAEWENHIGIYTSADATGRCLSQAPFTPCNLYFVISNPRFSDGTAVTSINAFELKVLIDGQASAIFRLAETLPAGAINVGAATDPYSAEYVAGWPVPTPVVGGVCSVMSWSVLFLAPGPWYFRLSPTTNPGLAGRMAHSAPVGGETVLVGCMPSSDDFMIPVFAVESHCEVASETTPFGNVKALFR